MDISPWGLLPDGLIDILSPPFPAAIRFSGRGFLISIVPPAS
jgi:hypothetical protein